jgi:hypothetical protein
LRDAAEGAALEKDLLARCPGRSFKVYPGVLVVAIGVRYLWSGLG